LDRQGLVGWFVALANSLEKPVLEVLIDRDVIGRCEAGQPRPDVETAGHGDGFCGFSFDFPEDLSDEQIGRARVRFAGTELFLETPAEALAAGKSDESASAAPPKFAVTAPGAWPLFIVGSPRSGTSILVQAMFSAGYHGFEEGNLLGMVNPLFVAIDEHFRVFGGENPATLIGSLRSETFYREILSIFKKTIDNTHRTAPWLDKTGNPATIMILPYLVELWPTCRIIFAKRRGIENIISRVRKFPDYHFRYHCRDWAQNMHSWREVRERLGASRYLEVDQNDMMVRPKVVAASIAALLALGPSQRRRIEETLHTQRPQETAPGTASRVLALEDTSWDADQIANFLDKCGPEMEAFGYSNDRSYWRDPIDRPSEKGAARK
jgi:hypothetical protein